jgi:hypothetical protein
MHPVKPGAKIFLSKSVLQDGITRPVRRILLADQLSIFLFMATARPGFWASRLLAALCIKNLTLQLKEWFQRLHHLPNQ